MRRRPIPGASERSYLSVGSVGSVLSIGSVGSVLSIGSVGSVLSIGSVGSLASLVSAVRTEGSTAAGGELDGSRDRSGRHGQASGPRKKKKHKQQQKG